MLFTISSQSPHHLHSRISIFRFNIIGLCFVWILKEIQLLSWGFSFLPLVKIFLCAISSVCSLKYPYSYFSSHFCFLVSVIFVFVPILPELLLVGVISLAMLFLSLHVLVLIPRLNPQRWWVLHSFLNTYFFLSLSPLGCDNLFILINFLVFCSIFLCSLFYFKNKPEYLTRTTQVFIPLFIPRYNGDR